MLMAVVLGGCDRRDEVEITTMIEKEEPASDFDLESYLEKANDHLDAQMQALDVAWFFGKARWDADQETGILKWTFEDGRTAEAPFQIVGTYSTSSGTFLWGWDHPSVLAPLQKDAKAVKAFAKEHGIGSLLERKVTCTEDEAWEFAAIANLLCERQGVYRGPSGSARVFMTFGEVTVRDAP